MYLVGPVAGVLAVAYEQSRNRFDFYSVYLWDIMLRFVDVEAGIEAAQEEDRRIRGQSFSEE